MPDVIKTTLKEDLAPHVREGYLMLYIYLPVTFGEDFSKYVAQIVPSLLKVCSLIILIYYLHFPQSFICLFLVFHTTEIDLVTKDRNL